MIKLKKALRFIGQHKDAVSQIFLVFFFKSEFKYDFDNMLNKGLSFLLNVNLNY